MTTIEYEVVTCKDRPDLHEACDKIIDPAWPEFMLHGAVCAEHWDDLHKQFPEYQFALMGKDTDNMLAAANSIPLFWDDDPYDLPDDGWDWALTQGLKDKSAGRNPTVLSALRIVIAEEYRSIGLSSLVVEIMTEMGRLTGCMAMIAPVRPTLKAVYPLTPMEQYIRWQDNDGLPFDPWMRVHARLGAELLKVCSRALRIEGSVSDWEGWTQMRFPESGKYVVPGGLIPVEIDCEKDRGLYVEPNVWMGHPIR
jgi:hypothetical protein